MDWRVRHLRLVGLALCVSLLIAAGLVWVALTRSRNNRESPSAMWLLEKLEPVIIESEQHLAKKLRTLRGLSVEKLDAAMQGSDYMEVFAGTGRTPEEAMSRAADEPPRERMYRVAGGISGILQVEIKDAQVLEVRFTPSPGMSRGGPDSRR